MLEQLIVPLDGSPLAERTLNYAVQIARGIGARLVLLRVVADPAEQPAARDYLAPLVQSVAASGVSVHPVVDVGEPSRVIGDQARPDRDLVVLTSDGDSGPGNWSDGTIVAKVLNGGNLSVLLIRPAFTRESLVDDGSRPVLLVPLDGSPAAETAIPIATMLARGLNGDVALLGVVDQEPATPTGMVFWGVAPAEPPIEDEEIVRGYLDGVIAQIQLPGLVVVPAVRVGMPAAEIADAARDAEAALIVMTTRGGSGSQPGLGPVAQELLLHDNRPILFVRPP